MILRLLEGLSKFNKELLISEREFDTLALSVSKVGRAERIMEWPMGARARTRTGIALGSGRVRVWMAMRSVVPDTWDMGEYFPLALLSIMSISWGMDLLR